MNKKTCDFQCFVESNFYALNGPILGVGVIVLDRFEYSDSKIKEF